MKTLGFIIALMLPFAVWGQNYSKNTIQIFGPKYLGDVDVSVNNTVKNTVTKVKLYFNNGEFDHTNDFTPLYLNQTTMDLTIVDENTVISYVASEQAFYLNQFNTNNQELLPQGSTLEPVKAKQDDENIFLSWIVDDKELEITLWTENLKKSLERESNQVIKYKN